MRKERVIRLLLEGRTQREAAEIAGVGEVTVSRWMCWDETFRMELEMRQDQVREGHTEDMRRLAGKALRTLETLMDDASPHVQMRAAMAVVRANGLDELPAPEPVDALDEIMNGALDILGEEMGLAL